MKRSTKSVLVFALAASMVFSSTGVSSAKAKKPKLSKSKVTITVGKKVTIKVKKVKPKKTKWTLTKKGKKIVSLSKKKKTSVKIKGKKKGKATLTAKITVGKKTYKKKVKITVKKKTVKKPTPTPPVVVKPTPTPTLPGGGGSGTPGPGGNGTPTPTPATATDTPEPATPTPDTSKDIINIPLTDVKVASWGTAATYETLDNGYVKITWPEGADAYTFARFNFPSMDLTDYWCVIDAEGDNASVEIHDAEKTEPAWNNPLSCIKPQYGKSFPFAIQLSEENLNDSELADRDGEMHTVEPDYLHVAGVNIAKGTETNELSLVVKSIKFYKKEGDITYAPALPATPTPAATTPAATTPAATATATASGGAATASPRPDTTVVTPVVSGGSVNYNDLSADDEYIVTAAGKEISATAEVIAAIGKIFDTENVYAKWTDSDVNEIIKEYDNGIKVTAIKNGNDSTKRTVVVDENGVEKTYDATMTKTDSGLQVSAENASGSAVSVAVSGNTVTIVRDDVKVATVTKNEDGTYSVAVDETWATENGLKLEKVEKQGPPTPPGPVDPTPTATGGAVTGGAASGGAVETQPPAPATDTPAPATDSPAPATDSPVPATPTPEGVAVDLAKVTKADGIESETLADGSVKFTWTKEDASYDAISFGVDSQDLTGYYCVIDAEGNNTFNVDVVDATKKNKTYTSNPYSVVTPQYNVIFPYVIELSDANLNTEESAEGETADYKSVGGVSINKGGKTGKSTLVVKSVKFYKNKEDIPSVEPLKSLEATGYVPFSEMGITKDSEKTYKNAIVKIKAYDNAGALIDEDYVKALENGVGGVKITLGDSTSCNYGWGDGDAIFYVGNLGKWGLHADAEGYWNISFTLKDDGKYEGIGFQSASADNAVTKIEVYSVTFAE